MSASSSSFVRQHTGSLRVVLSTALILLIPLVAMQFTDEVKWGPFDFLIIGILLLSAGFAFELILKKVKDTNHRIILGVILLLLVIYVWVELAVGIFTNLGS